LTIAEPATDFVFLLVLPSRNSDDAFLAIFFEDRIEFFAMIIEVR
jgi:hypothetical protein